MKVGFEESDDVSRCALIEGKAVKETDTALMMNGRAESLTCSSGDAAACVFIARRTLLRDVKSTVSEYRKCGMLSDFVMVSYIFRCMGVNVTVLSSPIGSIVCAAGADGVSLEEANF